MEVHVIMLGKISLIYKGKTNISHFFSYVESKQKSNGDITEAEGGLITEEEGKEVRMEEKRGRWGQDR